MIKDSYEAEVRCMFCDCLLGKKGGFTLPDITTHGIGECCKDFAMNVWGVMR